MSRTKQFLADRGGDVVEEEIGSVEVAMGSRLMFRLFGVSEPGLKRLPMKLTVSADAEGNQTRVGIEMESDEGSYLLGRLPIADDAYETQFDALMAELQQVLV